jgi:hypothetical protein
MADKDKINRRTFLRTGGIALGAMTVTPSIAAANDAAQTLKKEECDCVTVLTNTQTVKKWKNTDADGTTHVFKRYKQQDGKVEYKTIDDMTGVSTRDVGTYDTLVKRSNAFTRDLGGCPSFYSNHAYTGVSFEFVKNINNLGASAVSSLICGIIGLPAGGVGGIALGVVCGTLATAVVGNIEGSTTTTGLYDDEGGFFNQPQVYYGIGSGYNTGVGGLMTTDTIPGAHIAPVVL